MPASMSEKPFFMPKMLFDCECWKPKIIRSKQKMFSKCFRPDYPAVPKMFALLFEKFRLIKVNCKIVCSILCSVACFVWKENVLMIL